MKAFFRTKTLLALAVALAAATSAVSQAQAQPMPPPLAGSALPADIEPGSPLAEVIKMIQAGVDVSTIQSYIVNAQSPFNLDADKIIFLKDEGVPSSLINAMLDRDKVLYAATMTPPPATVDTSVPDTAPPPDDITINYFYDTLTPYGTWLDVDGYGRCWRPTAVIYDPAWRPYGDRGHWVYTDYGWYWDSDYSWGATFHYGRWFHDVSLGWCWYPDTVWAPSWVTWRSGGDYCGWAPLPPFAVYRPGAGFFYRGVSVGLDFDFGQDADCFLFVSTDHFCDRHPRSFCVAQQYVPQIYHQTTVINNFNVNSRTIVNRGIAVDRITSVTHQPIAAVHVSSLANAGRQGWRGEGFQQTLQRAGAENNNHNAAINNNNNNNPGRAFASGNADNNQPPLRRDNFGQAAQGSQPGNGHQQQQQLQQTRRVETYAAPNQVTPQNSQNEGPQNRNFNNNNNNAAVYGSFQQNGAQQAQQRQYVTPMQPREDARQPYVEPQTRSHPQPAAPPAPSAPQSQPESHPSGNAGGASSSGSTSGSGNSANNTGSERGSDKQNH